MRFKKPFFTSQIDSRVFIQDYTIQYLRCIAYMRLKLRRSWHQQWGVVTWMIKKKVTILMVFFLFLLCRVSEISLSGNFLNNSRTFFFLFSHNSFPEMSLCENRKNLGCVAPHITIQTNFHADKPNKKRRKTHITNYALCNLKTTLH